MIFNREEDSMEEAMFLIKPDKKYYKDCFFSFCGYSKTQPKHSFGPSIRDVYLIHIVLEGKGYYSINNQKYYLESGQGFIIPPGVSTFYQANNENPWSYIWLGVGGDKIEDYFQKLGLYNNHFGFDVSNSEEFKALIFETLAYDSDNFIDEIRLQKQTFRFIELLIKSISNKGATIKTKKMNHYVIKAIKLISEDSYKNISVATISERLSLNPSYLSRLFKKEVGMSIKEYINHIRITTSNDLLTSTNYSIQEISEIVGFSTSQNFSKAFKKYHGITPTLYRKQRIGFSNQFE